MVVETEFWPGNSLSYTTTIIKLFKENILLSNATGFVMKYGGHYALVTNWHVLSGCNPISGKVLSKTGGVPDRISFHVTLTSINHSNGKKSELRYFKPCEIALSKSGENVWIDNKDESNQNDYCIILLESIIPELGESGNYLESIIAGKVTLRKGIDTGSANKRPFRPHEIKAFFPEVGSDVFIIGYPSGITYSEIFPIWKKASIASEPLIIIDNNSTKTNELFYTDGLTKHGMSGSPVVRIPNIGDLCYTDDGTVVEIKDRAPILLGVYAGRDGVTQEEYELALGRVWKIRAIELLFEKALQIKHR